MTKGSYVLKLKWSALDAAHAEVGVLTVGDPVVVPSGREDRGSTVQVRIPAMFVPAGVAPNQTPIGVTIEKVDQRMTLSIFTADFQFAFSVIQAKSGKAYFASQPNSPYCDAEAEPL